MVLKMPKAFLTLIALSQLSLSASALVINDFAKKDMSVNNLGFPSSSLRGPLIEVPDGVCLRSGCGWSEQLTEPNKYMAISDKALLIKGSVPDKCNLDIDLNHRESEGSFGSSKSFQQDDLPWGVGEFILPFTTDDGWDFLTCAYQHAKSISIHNICGGDVDIEQIELVNFSGEDKERLLWTESYMKSCRYVFQRHNLRITNADQVLEEAYKEVMNMDDPGRPLKVVFIDRHAQDDQTTEFFSRLSQEIFKPEHGFFTYSEETKTYEINSKGYSHIFYKNLPGTMKLQGVENPQIYRFIGRIIGQALIHNDVLDGDLSVNLIKAILNMEITLSDVASFDPCAYQTMHWLINNDVSECYDKTLVLSDVSSFDPCAYQEMYLLINHDFSESYGKTKVTNENKHEYVRRLIQKLYIDPVKEQINDIRQGILDVVPKMARPDTGRIETVCPISSSAVDFSRRVSGRAEVSQAEWEKWTYFELGGYTKRDDQVRWFWNTVASLDDHMFKKLFRIVFGFNRLPFVGFQGLLPQVFVLGKATPADSAANVDEQVPEVVVDSARLKKIRTGKPQISVAWNLRVPPYSSQEIFDTQIRAFIQNN